MTPDDFLNRYNPNRSEIEAIRQSIGAAVKRNPTYSPHLNNREKYPFKQYWINELVRVSDLFKTNRNSVFYLNQVTLLKENLHLQSGDILDPQKDNYDSGFRIAHAQKSLSVFLKHLWCMNEIPPPPCCAIDRIIANKANVVLEVSWTKMNYIAQVEAALRAFELLAKENGKSLCEWELELF